MRNHILRYDKEVEVLEDYIEAVRYGLAEQGGFMRYNSLTMELRRNMFSLERGNIVIHNIKLRRTENTDFQPGDSEESSEEENISDDEEITSETEDAWEGPVTVLRMAAGLRRSQHEALVRGDSHEAGETQRLLLALTQRRDGMLDPVLADDLFNFDRRAYRRSRSSGFHEVAPLYDNWSIEIRALVDWGNG